MSANAPSFPRRRQADHEQQEEQGIEGHEPPHAGAQHADGFHKQGILFRQRRDQLGRGLLAVDQVLDAHFQQPQAFVRARLRRGGG